MTEREIWRRMPRYERLAYVLSHVVAAVALFVVMIYALAQPLHVGW